MSTRDCTYGNSNDVKFPLAWAPPIKVRMRNCGNFVAIVIVLHKIMAASLVRFSCPGPCPSFDLGFSSLPNQFWEGSVAIASVYTM